MRIRFQYVNLMFIFFASCSTSKTDDSSINNDTTTITDDEALASTRILNSLKSIDLTGKIFEVGSKTDFTDSCSFYFECDCCSGELMFDKDSTFYYKSYCVADLDMTFGRYFISENILRLEYSGKIISKIFNEDHESDTTVTEYFIRDTIVQSFTTEFAAYSCSTKIKFEEKEGNEIMLSTNDGNKSFFIFWTREELLERFEGRRIEGN